MGWHVVSSLLSTMCRSSHLLGLGKGHFNFWHPFPTWVNEICFFLLAWTCLARHDIILLSKPKNCASSPKGTQCPFRRLVDEMSSNFAMWCSKSFCNNLLHYHCIWMASCRKGHFCPFWSFDYFFHFLHCGCTQCLLLSSCPNFEIFRACGFQKGHASKSVPFAQEAMKLPNNGEIVSGLAHLFIQWRYICPGAFLRLKGQNVPFWKEAIKVYSDQ